MEKLFGTICHSTKPSEESSLQEKGNLFHLFHINIILPLIQK